MRFKDVFSIIGPGMVGPSSSHTAGAVRLGRVARRIFGSMPVRAEIKFYGSFAETYQGHGTDLAITAGLLDLNTDDLRIPTSLELAETLGMEILFKKAKGLAAHPNTAEIILTTGDQSLKVIGASIGGGNIEILKVNDFDIKFTGEYPTLLIFHDDRPGMIAEVTRLLSTEGVNIGYMDVDRKGRSEAALTVIEVDNPLTAELMALIKEMPNVQVVCKVDLEEVEEDEI